MFHGVLNTYERVINTKMCKGCDVNKRNIFQNKVYDRKYFSYTQKALLI